MKLFKLITTLWILLSTPLHAQVRITDAAIVTSAASADWVFVNDSGALRQITLSNFLTSIGAQPSDADLTSIASLTTTSVGRGLLDDADQTALRASIGLVIGTDVQAADSDLTAIAALSTTSAGRGLLDDADAAALRGSIGVVIGTNVEAWDADLDVWATKTAPSGTVVGSNDAQALTNKTYSGTATTIALTSLPGTGTTTPIFGNVAAAVAANETVFPIYGYGQNTGSVTGVTAHMGGGVFRADDTSAGKVQLFGVEGRVDGFGTATYQSVFGLSTFIGSTLTKLGGVFVRSEAFETNGTTPQDSGANIGVEVNPMIGGATQRAWMGYNEMENRAAIGSYSSDGSKSAKISHNNTDGTLATSSGKLILTGSSGSYIPAGTGTGQARIGGTLSVNTTSVGNVTGGEDTLMTYTLPGGTLSADGDTLRVRQAVKFATNGNVKTIKQYFGGSVTYGLAAAISGGTEPTGFFVFETSYTRTSATTVVSVTAVNISTDSITQGASAVLQTVTETLSGDLTIRLAGESASSASNDLVQVFQHVYLHPAP